MTVLDKLKGAAINAYLGGPGQTARAAVAEARRVLARESRRVDFYYDITDPGSHLMAQAVDRLARAYPVEMAFHLISPPATDVDPEPLLRARYAVRDAIDVAQHWDVEFPGKKELEAQVTRRAGSVLVKSRPFAHQLAVALEIGDAMWANDHKRLMLLIGKHGAESMGTVLPYTNAGYETMRRSGGFQGSSLSYGGDWFMGIDRVRYLEARLARDTGKQAPPVLTERPASTRPPVRLVLVSLAVLVPGPAATRAAGRRLAGRAPAATGAADRAARQELRPGQAAVPGARRQARSRSPRHRLWQPGRSARRR
jgi:2-hydroxychromene-2-carboxylate isomerase